jgi:putative copper export protein
MPLSLFVLWLHILAVAIWLGGMLFLLIVLIPLFHGTLPAREEMQIAYAAGKRYHFVASRAMETILLTGIVNLFTRGGDVFSRGFLTILGLKVVGFLLMAGLQTWQRISLHRQLTPLLTAGGGGVLGEHQWHAIRARLTQVTRLNLTLGAVVLFLALMLRRV